MLGPSSRPMPRGAAAAGPPRIGGARTAHHETARVPGHRLPAAPHDLRRTWTGDLLEAGVDLATVQKMAGHASVSTTGKYDRRDHGIQRRAAAELHVPYVEPEGR
jgi:site-specific recombinase XerD